jgi:hypothetical protein
LEPDDAEEEDDQQGSGFAVSTVQQKAVAFGRVLAPEAQAGETVKGGASEMLVGEFGESLGLHFGCWSGIAGLSMYGSKLAVVEWPLMTAHVA